MKYFTLLIFALIVCADAYVIKPQELFIVGDARPGNFFWQPSHAMSIGDGRGVFRASRSREGCSTCRYSAVLFDENGTFSAFNYDRFCGSGGYFDGSTLTCLSGFHVLLNSSAAEVSLVKYAFDAGSISETNSEEKAVFLTGDFQVAALTLANDVLHFPERNTFVVSGSLLLENSSSVHAFFRSNDLMLWNLTSVVPFEMGRETTIHRLGETKLLIISGQPGNYTQATSVFLGSRWEKVESVAYAAPLSTWVSPYYTTIYGGVKGRPGVTAMAAGPKKGSEKPIDVTELHNRLVTKQQMTVGNFSVAYKEATSFACLDGSTEDSNGCASSSFVAVTSLRNGTVFLLYDKLDNGFNEADATKGSTIFAMKLSLNETKEELEHQSKIEQQKKEAEREKQREEARRKAQEEAEERKKKERRAKIRRDKARRAEFLEKDKKFWEQAEKYRQEDGETIIVRDVDPDFVDVEKDTFFF